MIPQEPTYIVPSGPTTGVDDPECILYCHKKEPVTEFNAKRAFKYAVPVLGCQFVT